MHWYHYRVACDFFAFEQTRASECYLYDMARDMRHNNPFWAAIWKIARHDTSAAYRMIARRIIVYFEQGFC